MERGKPGRLTLALPRCGWFLFSGVVSWRWGAAGLSLGREYSRARLTRLPLDAFLPATKLLSQLVLISNLLAELTMRSMSSKHRHLEGKGRPYRQSRKHERTNKVTQWVLEKELNWKYISWCVCLFHIHNSVFLLACISVFNSEGYIKEHFQSGL